MQGGDVENEPVVIPSVTTRAMPTCFNRLALSSSTVGDGVLGEEGESAVLAEGMPDKS